jgi:prevent-host-death family protein
MKAISYGVRELQAHLGQALRAVQQGDRVIITSHGRPIAVMGKVESRPTRKSSVEEKLLRMAAEGRLLLGRKRGQKITPFKAPLLSGLTQQVLMDRR